VQTGDNIYVLGYPGAATYNPMVDQNASAIQTTFTSGVVSASRMMSGGWNAIQIDAPIAHGNSGGPVFNSNGQVIGIATFMSQDQNGGQLVQGMNFAVPISIAKEFINQLNIKPAESEFTKDYIQALTLYNQNKYKSALAIFNNLNALDPGYSFIQDYISKCTANINAGKDKSGDVGITILYIVIGIIVIGGIIAAIIFLTKKFNFEIRVRNKVSKSQETAATDGSAKSESFDKENKTDYEKSVSKKD
jgi:hypothetical protein